MSDREKAIQEICKVIDDGMFVDTPFEAALRLARNALSDEEEGRCLVLPCKLGDIVWKIVSQRDNYDDRPRLIAARAPFELNMLSSIGKSVFITPEEAEAMLAKVTIIDKEA
jgi:hypothetical protein